MDDLTEFEEGSSVVHEVKSSAGSGVRIVRGRAAGQDFVRIDNLIAGARFGVRVDPEQAGELGSVLKQLACSGRLGTLRGKIT